MKDIEELKRIRERDEEDDLMHLQNNLGNRVQRVQHEKKCCTKIPNSRENHHKLFTNLIAMIIAEFLAIAILCGICANTMTEVAQIADDLVEANKLNVELQNQLEYYSNFITESSNQP